MAEHFSHPPNGEAAASPAESLHTVFRFDSAIRTFNFSGMHDLQTGLEKQLAASPLDARSRVEVFHGFETGAAHVAFQSADEDSEQAMGRHAAHLWAAAEAQGCWSDGLVNEVRSIESHRLTLNGIEHIWGLMRDLTPHYEDLDEARSVYGQEIEISDFL